MERLIVRVLFGPATPHARRITCMVALGVVAVAWVVHAATLPPHFPFDDAYVTLDGASVLAGVHGPSYGSTSPLVGATSTVHLLGVTALAWVLPPAWALHSAMWLGIVAYTQGVLRLAFCHKASVLQAAALVLVSTLVADTPLQLLNGLETGWAMAALVWALAFACDDLRYGRRLAALAGLMPLLRPELGAISMLLLLHQSARRWAQRRSSQWWRGVLSDLAIALAVALPFVALTWHATGSLLPVTIHAKRAFFAEDCLYPALRRVLVWTSLDELVHLLGVFAAAAALLALTALGRTCILFVAIFLFAYYEAFPGSLAHSAHRYLYPLLPCLIYGAASCLQHRRAAVRVATTLLVVVAVFQSAIHAASPWSAYLNRIQKRDARIAAIAREAQRSIPRDARVLVHDAGYFSYATDLRLVDLVGLRTPASAAVHARLTGPSCGRLRAEAIHEIAVREQATHLIVSPSWNHIFGIAKALESHDWKLERVATTSFSDYEVYALTPPAGAASHF